jgi:predicted secreted protein
MTENTSHYSDEQLAFLLNEAQNHERQRLLKLFSRRLTALASQVSLCQFNSIEAAELLQDEAEKLHSNAIGEVH